MDAIFTFQEAEEKREATSFSGFVCGRHRRQFRMLVFPQTSLPNPSYMLFKWIVVLGANVRLQIPQIDTVKFHLVSCGCLSQVPFVLLHTLTSIL